MKNLEAKLAAGIRQVMTGNPQTPDNASQPATSPAVPPPASALAARTTTFGTTQFPKNSLNNPWANLHPQRIWPD